MLHYIENKSILIHMHILIISAGFILWYLAYEAKPVINEDLKNIYEEKNIIKRNRILGILKQSI